VKVVAIEGRSLGTKMPRTMPGQSSRLLQTKADAWVRAAFCAVWSSTARTEHGDQSFSRIATDGAVRLYRSDGSARRSGVTFFTFCSGRALRPLRSLGALLSLSPGNALHALRALRSRRPLRTGISFRARFFSATCQRQRHPEDNGHNNLFHSRFLRACHGIRKRKRHQRNGFRFDSYSGRRLTPGCERAL
jgi:hypothetical protein